MFVVSIKTGVQDGANFFKIELSDGSFFHVKEYYLSDHSRTLDSGEELGLSEEVVLVSVVAGKEISADKEEVLRFADVCYRAERI